MRRPVLWTMMIALQACSALPFLAPPAPAQTSTPSITPSITATSSPTVTPPDTSTSTPLPTIVHFPTQDPNLPTATFIPIPIIVPGGTATQGVFLLPTVPGPGAGFASVSISDNKIFWGSCKPNRTRIVAKVQVPDEVWSVVIFVRVKSAKKEDYTPWTRGDVMFKYPGGKFTYLLLANNTYGRNHYRDSWIIFQLVATNINGVEVGRTQIFNESIALSPCM